MAELRRGDDLHADLEVAATRTAEARDPPVLDRDHLGALGSRLDVEGDLPVECLEGRGDPEDRVGHLHLEGREQVVAIAAEHLVVTHLDLEVEVAFGATGGADLTLGRHLQSQPGVDASGDVDGDVAAGANAALSLAGGAGVGDDRAVAAAGAAGARGHHVAEQAANGTLDLAGSTADVARHRVGAGCRARPLAGLAEHSSVDFEVALGTEDDLLEVDLDADERVLTPLPTAARARTAAASPAEERLEDVTESAEVLSAGTLLRSEIVLLTLLRVGQHVVGVRHRLEFLGGVRPRVHVGVQLPRESAVRLLDLVRGRLTRHAERFVMICQSNSSGLRSGPGHLGRRAASGCVSARRSGPRRAGETGIGRRP